MGTPLIPKLFVQHVAGGLPHLAERLWNAPHPRLWDRTPAELWNDAGVPPFRQIAYRERILTVLAPCKPDPLLEGRTARSSRPIVRPEAPDESIRPGNGKSATEISRSDWETLFGIDPAY
ncbi:MAG TPA: hypothetical protein VJ553_02610 [Candidatus Paceibacterota bacterium]|nr:hypothetical protein [Candidatus Paceibacterota bacterium]